MFLSNGAKYSDGRPNPSLVKPIPFGHKARFDDPFSTRNRTPPRPTRQAHPMEKHRARCGTRRTRIRTNHFHRNAAAAYTMLLRKRSKMSIAPPSQVVQLRANSAQIG